MGLLHCRNSHRKPIVWHIAGHYRIGTDAYIVADSNVTQLLSARTNVYIVANLRDAGFRQLL
jgi:hypothetical protein